MEAMITLNYNNYSHNIIDILQTFQQIGWGIYNNQGKVEFLPINDNGMCEWQCEEISRTKLYSIISDKLNIKEQIGINLFYDNSIQGISFLANSIDKIILALTINRKTIKDKHTDVVWYMENIVYKLFDTKIKLLSYKFEEFED